MGQAILPPGVLAFLLVQRQRDDLSERLERAGTIPVRPREKAERKLRRLRERVESRGTLEVLASRLTMPHSRFLMTEEELAVVHELRIREMRDRLSQFRGG